MKFIHTIIVLLLLLAGESYAQVEGVRISLLPTYQHWDLKFETAGGVAQPDIQFSELTVPLAIHLPIGRSLGFSIRSSQASASSDQLTSIDGMADTQLALSYRLQPANLIFNVNVNLPTGQTELSAGEFATTALIGHNGFGLRMPNFGQGTNVQASLTWVYPVRDAFVIGLGASYQVRGGFKPLADLAEEYRPGAEVLVTAGFDARLGSTTNFSTDVSVTRFGTDKLGDVEVFASGQRLVASAQLRTYAGFNEFRLLGRVRTKARNEQALVLGQPLVEEIDNTTGNQFEVQAHYRHRLSQQLYGKLLFDGRFYQAAAGFQDFATTPFSSGITVLGFGLGPEWVVSRRVTIPIVGKYYTGGFEDGPDVTGFEVGLGLQLSF